MLNVRFEIDDNFLFKAEPLLGITPNEVYGFLRENGDDYSLCYAFFGVFNEGVYLTNRIEWECSEDERPQVQSLIDEWREVELDILEKILKRMNIPMTDGEPPIGYYYVVKPFMEKNGFLADKEIFFH